MRLIKGFVLAIVGLFIVITLLSLLMPSKVMVAKSVVIHAPLKKVMDQIDTIQHWKNWQPFFKSDSVQVHFNSVVTGKGASCQWNSNGHENKFIVTASSLNQVDFTLVRKGENDVLNTITVTASADTNQVQVEWRALTKLKWYPWEKFYGIFIDKMTGPGYEEALRSLKEHVENASTLQN